MDFSIRNAVPTDWPGVGALLTELGRPAAQDDDEEDLYRKIFESYLQRDDAEAFVADSEGEVVGFINVEYRPRLNYEPPQAWIPELIVREAARGARVGKQLLARAEAAARARGCWGMALESANWRADAHRFYKREGWDGAAKAFIKNLRD